MARPLSHLWFIAVVGVGSAFLAASAAVARPPPPSVVVEVAVPVVTEKPARSDPAGALLYAARCAMCHGALGQGDGAAAAAFPVRATDLSDRFLQAARAAKWPRIVVDGGKAHGLSPLMPPASDLTPAQLDALMTHLKSLASPNGTARARVCDVTATAPAGDDGIARVRVPIKNTTGCALSVETWPKTPGQQRCERRLTTPSAGPLRCP